MLDIYQDALDRFLDDDPGLAKDYKAPKPGKAPFFIQCPLLDENGLCLVYAHRPLTCHAYGQPRKAPNSTDGIDYCYRNFSNLKEGVEIPADLILDYQEIVRERNHIERELYEVVLGKRVNRFFQARIAEFLVLGLDTLKWDEFLPNVSSQAFIAMEFVKHICPAEFFTDLHRDGKLFESVCEWHASHSGDPALVQDIDSVLDSLEKLLNAGQIPAYSRIRSLVKERGTLFLGYIVLNISQRYLSSSR
jgi:Fe-S-cluster containining protein